MMGEHGPSTADAMRPSEWRQAADVEIAAARGCRVVLRVLGHFDLISARTAVEPGGSARRLLGLLAIEDRPLRRDQISARLWPDTSAPRALANLRSVVWRLRRCCPGAIAGTTQLRLTSAVITDISVARAVASWLLDRSGPVSADRLSIAMRANLREDLLPAWCEEAWIAPERERFRQLRVHALEALAGRLIEAGWFGAGVDTALAAVRSDPYRESAYTTLVNAYLAEGSYREARDCAQRFRMLLREELGLEPSAEFDVLLHARPRRCACHAPSPDCPNPPPC